MVVGDTLLDMKFAKIPPGIVETKTTMKIIPAIVPLKSSSAKNVTATVVKELIAAKRESNQEAW